MNKALIISNMELGDVTFTSDTGSWNVTRALRDCNAGKHRGYLVGLEDCLAKNASVEVDTDKIKAMVADPNFLSRYPPLILALENGMAWLIDGHHRMRALLLLGQTEARAWVIEEADAAPYKIYYNGQRVAPWYRSK